MKESKLRLLKVTPKIDSGKNSDLFLSKVVPITEIEETSSTSNMHQSTQKNFFKIDTYSEVFDTNPNLINNLAPVRLESFDEELVGENEYDEEKDYYDSEDSNSENNARNDYPDDDEERDELDYRSEEDSDTQDSRTNSNDDDDDYDSENYY